MINVSTKVLHGFCFGKCVLLLSARFASFALDVTVPSQHDYCQFAITKVDPRSKLHKLSLTFHVSNDSSPLISLLSLTFAFAFMLFWLLVRSLSTRVVFVLLLLCVGAKHCVENSIILNFITINHEIFQSGRLCRDLFPICKWIRRVS